MQTKTVAELIAALEAVEPGPVRRDEVVVQGALGVLGDAALFQKTLLRFRARLAVLDTGAMTSARLASEAMLCAESSSTSPGYRPTSADVYRMAANRPWTAGGRSGQHG